jgi:hypothetical protein
MRRLLLTLAVLIAAPASASPLATSRTRLSAEPDRDSLVAWSRDGTLDLVWTLGGKSVQSRAMSLTEEWYDSAFHGSATLPDLRPGRYTLDCGTGHTAQIDVVQPPNRKPVVHVAADKDSLKNCRKAIQSGNLEIILDPGEHVWAGAFAAPAWTILRGEKATVRQVGAGDYNNRTIVPTGADVSVYGITFLADIPCQIFHCEPPQSGLNVIDCTFKRVNFGYGPTDVLVRDCRFDSAGVVIGSPGLWLRCTFTGPPTMHAFSYWSGGNYAGKYLAMIDGTFSGTDRGPGFQTAAGPMTDGLFVGTRCHGIQCTVPNGGEIFLCEGAGGFSNHVILHTRVWSCASPVFQFDSVARNNLIRDLSVDGGLGVMLWGSDITDNEFDSFELRGCGVYCGPGAKRNKFTNGTSVGFLPTRGNQTWRQPSPMCDSRRIVFCAEGSQAATNTLTNVNALAVPSGFMPTSGVRVMPAVEVP